MMAVLGVVVRERCEFYLRPTSALRRIGQLLIIIYRGTEQY
jgi:hypothetical protein